MSRIEGRDAHILLRLGTTTSGTAIEDGVCLWLHAYLLRRPLATCLISLSAATRLILYHIVILDRAEVKQ